MLGLTWGQGKEHGKIKQLNLPQEGFGQTSEPVGSRCNVIFNLLEVHCYSSKGFRIANAL